MSKQQASPLKFVAVFTVGLASFFCCLSPVFYWLYQGQRAMDEGAQITVFNNSDAAVSLVFDGDSSTLPPRQGWRSDELREGEHTVEIGARSLTVDTGYDAAGYLIAVEPVALVVVDTAAEFANLGTGTMMGSEVTVVGSYPAADVIRVPRRWTLSPYDALPQSTFGGAPHKALIIEPEAVGDAARLQAIVAETPL